MRKEGESLRLICRGLLCFLRDMVALHTAGTAEKRLCFLSLSGLLLSLSADYCSDSALLSAAGETRMTRLHFDIFCHDG